MSLEDQLVDVIRRGTSAAIDMPDDQDKLTQEETNYGEPNDDDEGTCDQCRHYQGYSCELVKGEIEPGWTCDEWAPRKHQVQVAQVSSNGR